MRTPSSRVEPRLSRRRALAVGGAALSATALAACGGAQRLTSEEANESNPLVLRMANNLDPQHVTSVALEEFITDVQERSGGRIHIEHYASGQLGGEPQVLGQLRQGIVDLTRVGAPGLAAWDRGYHAFGLPYVFDSEEHYYAALDSEAMRDFFAGSQEQNFLGLTYYTSGARSFYTASTPIRTPDDLAGLKIRIQDMATQVQMTEAFGASPIVMGFGDTYTALQTGLIDGAESNETVLNQSGHGEVSKAFSLTEHTRIPDMLVIGTRAWDRLCEEDRTLLQEAAIASTEAHKEAWAQSIEEAYAESEEMGVEFIEDVDTDAFAELAAPVVEEFASRHQEVADLLDIIDQARS